MRGASASTAGWRRRRRRERVGTAGASSSRNGFAGRSIGRRSERVRGRARSSASARNGLVAAGAAGLGGSGADALQPRQPGGLRPAGGVLPVVAGAVVEARVRAGRDARGIRPRRVTSTMRTRGSAMTQRSLRPKPDGGARPICYSRARGDQWRAPATRESPHDVKAGTGVRSQRVGCRTRSSGSTPRRTTRRSRPPIGRLARRFHPDVAGDGATRQMIGINAAFDTVRDREAPARIRRRARRDRPGPGRQGAGASARPAGPTGRDDRAAAAGARAPSRRRRRTTSSTTRRAATAPAAPGDRPAGRPGAS